MVDINEAYKRIHKRAYKRIHILFELAEYNSNSSTYRKGYRDAICDCYDVLDKMTDECAKMLSARDAECE